MDHQSIGKIISRVGRNGAKYIEKNLKEFDLGYGQFQILIELEEFEKVKQEEIVVRVCVDKTTLARTIKKLETLDYITREQNPHDLRAYEISLTKHGVAVRKGVIKVLKKYTTQLLKGFDEDDAELLYSLMEIVLANSKNLE